MSRPNYNSTATCPQVKGRLERNSSVFSIAGTITVFLITSLGATRGKPGYRTDPLSASRTFGGRERKSGGFQEAIA
jgi:hypothetical protein